MSTQVLYGLLYLEVNVIASLLILFIRFKTLGISKMVSQRNFSFAIDAMIVFFLSDTAAVLMNVGLIPYSKIGMIAAKSIYFLSTALMCFYWFIYFEHLQGSAFVESRRAVLMSSCLIWILVILLIINLFTGILFFVDDDRNYQRGPLFVIQYLLAYIYVFSASGHAFLRLIQNPNTSQSRLLRSLALFPVAPAGAGILQYFFPELPLACASLSFATLILYQNWLDTIISVDPLTKLKNRKQLAFSYEQWQWHEDSAPLYLLMIDANKFKAINDTYGHIQGDAALERIADALRLACSRLHSRYTIARYGGDEFAVLVHTDSEQEILELCERIHVCLSDLNRKAATPYDVSVSIGTAMAEKGKTLRKLIEEADAMLYEEKRRQRSSGPSCG